MAMVTKSATQQFRSFPPVSSTGIHATGIDRWLLRHLYSSLGNPEISIRLGDSFEVSPPGGCPVANITIQNRRTLLQLVLDPELGFGDGYTSGRITIDGRLVAALEEVFRSMSARQVSGWFFKAASPVLAFLQRNSTWGARKNIHRHYDLSTRFFRLWLDSQLVYSSAYFPDPALTLEEAQIAKMDYVCRKLNLQHGEHVVDIGCGWGALAFHMAKHYGARVQAFSNSHEQIAWARRRARELGFSDLVEFIEDDYRNISTQCDALVSIGMLEHVGKGRYRDMGGVIDRVLNSAGRGLIQTVSRNRQHPFNLWTRKRIFPGTYAPTLGQAMDLFEPGDFAVADVENLRPHYARTLEHWLARFEKASMGISDMFGADFVRLWRLYLAGSIAGFRSGSLQHFQILFARKTCPWIPMTRARLYAEKESDPCTEERMCAIH
jgi:cyclopropane-fatty-acyl-phospholipid synthase